MKAIHLTAYGNPAESLMMVEVSEPNAPSASEALARMEYAPIVYSDLLLANGMYFLNPKLPSVIGAEGAGIVEAIGPGVTSNWPDVAKQQSVGLRRPPRIYRSSPRYRRAVPRPLGCGSSHARGLKQRGRLLIHRRICGRCGRSG